MTSDAYTAHQHLRQLRNLTVRMEIVKLEYDDVFNRAQGCGSLTVGDRVQTSPKGDALEMAVVRLTELQDSYNDLFAEFLSLKEEFESLIGCLSNEDERIILRLYYLNECRDEKIAGIIHLTRQRVNQLRHQALDKVGKELQKNV